MNIREEIVTQRRRRIAAEGHGLGHEIPATRQVPLQPFVRKPFVICEIKRRSPSRGTISGNLDPVKQAENYARAGVQSVSVLTEEDFFSGSLKDLMEVKRRLPQLAVLRKDFLLDLQDVEVSFRAGADAILLIASMLDASDLEALYRRAKTLGMEVLVEVHTYTELLAVRALAPNLVGVNSRNLADFSMDMLLPPVLKHGIDWPCALVFESGIFSAFQARWIGDLGFEGILVGEAAVKNPLLAKELVAAMDRSQGTVPDKQNFWELVTRKLFYLNHLEGNPRYGGPLVKVCGITNREDAVLAARLGADLLGFVFAESPRRANLNLLREVADIPVLKVAVVVGDEGTLGPEEGEVREALAQGLLDAVQFHGDENPQACQEFPFPWYKAFRLASTGSLTGIEDFRSPRNLVDAFDKDKAGGTGRRVSDEIVREVAKRSPLWLAGGLNPGNIREVIRQYTPELVDVSSGLESSPGKKDPDKLKQFFEEIQHARS